MAGDYVEIKTPSYNSHFPHWQFESKPTIFCARSPSPESSQRKIEIWGSPDLTVGVKAPKKSESVRKESRSDLALGLKSGHATNGNFIVWAKSEEVKWKRELRSPRCRIGWSSSPR